MKIREFDFIGNRKKFYTLSIVIMLVILIATFVFGVKLDIQFKGGSIINYSYTGDINADEIKTIATDILKKDVTVNEKQGFGDLPNNFDITLTENVGVESSVTSELTTKLQEKYGDSIELLSITNVDPLIGKEFFAKSFVAVAFAALVLIVYIALRFKKISGWSAGVMAVLALLHDIIMVYGTFIIFGIPLDYNFIAVLLTILGYSINDTIVIYDRIRENQKRAGSDVESDEIVNKSINQSITRSTNTSISTVLVMVVICIVAVFSGVSSIISFAFPMIIGMISGVYSTIFIAGPLWVDWQHYKKKRAAKGKTVKAK